jgi:predicted RecA/RadA family phage recombinase
MAKNYLQPGDMLDVTAAGTVASGNVAVVGSIFGVAQHDAATGARVTIATRGVYRLPKAAVAIAEGDALYCLNNGTVTTSSGGGATLIGSAYRAAALGDTTVEVYVRG